YFLETAGAGVIERLPERIRTPAVARAVAAPTSVLLAGAGMALATLSGLPLAAAAAVGVAAWAARVALAVPRRPQEDRIDPFTVGEPWRHFVQEALQARTRFGQTAARARSGPLKDRLGELAGRLDRGVEECWRIAQQGDVLESALAQLGMDGIRRDLAQVRTEKVQASGADEQASLERAEQAVLGQLASAERIERVSRDARSRLRALNAQLDEAVARGVELSLQTQDAADLSPLSADVDDLVGELEALRQALEETNGQQALEA
ncbi:MAG: hypothetical protein ACRD1K_15110, partial [Acidimicrobiales bacterium]